MWLGNRWEYCVAAIGTAMCGLIMATVNPAYRSDEFKHAAHLVGMRALIMQSSLKTSNYHDILRDAGNIPTLDLIIQVGTGPFPERVVSFNKLLRDHERDKVSLTAHSPHEAVNIQFTSGTTGRPKGATLSHSNILNNAAAFGQRLGFDRDDILICPLPMYHW